MRSRRPAEKVGVVPTIEEGNLFRRVIGWSSVLLLVLCVLVFLQSAPVLGRLVP